MTVPDLVPVNPARILFVKVTKSLFGRKKNKSESGMPAARRVQSGGGGCSIHTRWGVRAWEPGESVCDVGCVIPAGRRILRALPAPVQVRTTPRSGTRCPAW